MDNNNDHNNIDDDDNLADARRQPILLNPEGQQLFSLFESYVKQELPPYTNSKMNEMVNNMTAEGGGGGGEDFVSTVRTSIVDCLFGRDKNNRVISDEQRGLTTTIADKEEWLKEEKRIETALRLFPDIVSTTRHGWNPIQWLVMREADNTYNLKNISLIPLIVKLGIETQQCNDESRGGLLSLPPSGRIPLQQIICYERYEHATNTTDECYSAVVERLREENLLVKEDIQEHHLVRNLLTNTRYFLEERLQYLVDWDPKVLSVPCRPENGNWLPIHWSTYYSKDGLRKFNVVFKAGMKYFPEKFGFVFLDCTHQQDNKKIFKRIPFQWACKKYGQENVMNELMIHLAEYRSITPTSTMTATATVTATTSTTTPTTTTTELSLLVSAVTDQSIHIDCLYILLRKDPAAVLLMLQQHFHQQQQLEEGDGQTFTTINTDNDNDNSDSNKKEITGDSTTTSTSSSLINVAGIATAAVTRTVSSMSTPVPGGKRGRPSESVPTSNKKNKSCASNNSNISSTAS